MRGRFVGAVVAAGTLLIFAVYHGGTGKGGGEQQRAAAISRALSATQLESSFCGNWNLSQAACMVAPCNSSSARNLIVIHEPAEFGAGIGDRMFVVHSSVQYAQALCARVIIPPPTHMLSEDHNKHNHVDCSWEWSRYFDWESMRPWVIDWYDVLKFPRCPRPDKKKDLIVLEEYARSSGHVVAANMGEAFDLYLKGAPFVLYMNPAGNTNGLYNQVIPSSCGPVLKEIRATPECNRMRIKTSELALGVARDLVRGLDHYCTIHIRRTDTMNAGCDNSPAKVRLLMNCELGQFNGDYPAIILFTDDTDPEYLSEILLIFGEFARKVIHCDSAAKARFKEIGIHDIDTDNYLIYMVSIALRLEKEFLRPGLKHIEFGGHGNGIRQQCDRSTRCARNGNQAAAEEGQHHPSAARPAGNAVAATTVRGCESVRGELFECGAAACEGQPAKSVLVLDDPPPPGLGAPMEDRTTMIAGMAQFAAALCARLVVPAPCRMLGGYGGARAEPPCLSDAAAAKGVAWARYVDWGEKGRSVVEESNALVAGAPYSEAASLAIAAADGVARRHVPRGDLAAAFELHRQRQPFVLTVSVHTIFNSFLSCRDMSQQLRESQGCDDVKRHPSSAAQHVADQMLAKVGGGNRGGGVFYAVVLLRRGHHHHGGGSLGCDNSPERVRAFLGCRLREFNGSLPALFFFTDEKDGAYLGALSLAAAEFAAAVVHGDAEARGYLVRGGDAELAATAETDHHLACVCEARGVEGGCSCRIIGHF